MGSICVLDRLERNQTTTASSFSTVESVKTWLDDHGVKGYTINSDLSVSTRFDVGLYKVHEKILPVTFRKVGGDFTCCDCSFETLQNFPMNVGGDFRCTRCPNLKLLKRGPKVVKKSFYVEYCGLLKTLEGAPSVGKNFSCSYNSSLISLKGCPCKINGDFSCVGCQNLTTLDYGPTTVEGSFYCYSSGLVSLEGGPKKVGCDLSMYWMPNLKTSKVCLNT